MKLFNRKAIRILGASKTHTMRITKEDRVKNTFYGIMIDPNSKGCHRQRLIIAARRIANPRSRRSCTAKRCRHHKVNPPGTKLSRKLARA